MIKQFFSTGRINRAKIKQMWPLYLFLIPAVLYLIIFSYIPIGGIYMAFTDFNPFGGVFGSPFVGLKHFRRLFSIPTFTLILRNTLTLSVYGLAAGFPIPILLAIFMNYSPSRKIKKLVQTTTYIPHFISTVIMVGMIRVVFAPNMGILVNVLNNLNLHEGSIRTLINEKAFPHLYVWSGIWQNMGYASIIYLAALTGVDMELHEAAMIDGASKLQRIVHVDIPHLMPTMVILLTLNSGHLLNVGFEKAYLLQNTLNYNTSEILSTYIYKIGILDAQYSFSTATNLFNSVINMTILLTVNKIAKQLGSKGIM